MVSPDILNGLFEFGGSLMIWLNVRALMRDRQVRGVCWPVTAFFWSWGLWNLYYYPSLHQWASFAGGACICAANCAWLILAVKYRRA